MSYGLTGSIDDFKIWNRVLAPTDISAIYWLNKPPIPLPPITTSLAAYFPLSNTTTESVSGLSVTAATTVTYITIGTPSKTGIVCVDGTYNAADTNKIINYNIPSLNITAANGISISFWMYYTSISNTPVVISLSATNCFYHALISSATFYFEFTQISPYAYQGISFATSNVPANQWNHIVFVLNPSGGTANANVYVNGGSKGTNNNAFTVASYNVSSSANRLSIGCSSTQDAAAGYNNATYRNFTGTIGKFAIYNTPLSAANVTTLYNAG